MKSKKVYYQHMYKDLLTEIDQFDGTESEVQRILTAIEALNKPSKQELLLNKLKSSQNFMYNFADMWTEEIDKLLEKNNKKS